MAAPTKFPALLLICTLCIYSSFPVLAGPCVKSCLPEGPVVVLPPVIKPPPVVAPPVIIPPVVGTPLTGACSVAGALKLGACVELLCAVVTVSVGDPVASECCPILAGMVETEAAACICSTLKLRLLNLGIFFPLALQLLAVCGKTPPTGYCCN